MTAVRYLSFPTCSNESKETFQSKSRRFQNFLRILCLDFQEEHHQVHAVLSSILRDSLLLHWQQKQLYEQ